MRMGKGSKRVLGRELKGERVCGDDCLVEVPVLLGNVFNSNADGFDGYPDSATQ